MSSADCLKCPLLSECTTEKAEEARSKLSTVDEQGNVVAHGDA